MGNPMQFMMQNKLNVPQEYMSNPNAAIQYMMNNGQLSQSQYEWARNMAQQIQNNPMFQQLFNQK